MSQRPVMPDDKAIDSLICNVTRLCEGVEGTMILLSPFPRYQKECCQNKEHGIEGITTKDFGRVLRDIGVFLSLSKAISELSTEGRRFTVVTPDTIWGKNVFPTRIVTGADGVHFPDAEYLRIIITVLCVAEALEANRPKTAPLIPKEMPFSEWIKEQKKATEDSFQKNWDPKFFLNTEQKKRKSKYSAQAAKRRRH